jgi:hypothetical protein
MAVLGRLDKRAAALDDRAMSVARSIGAAFEDFITLVLSGGGSGEITAFLAEHPDPLAAQIAASKTTPAPQLVEKSGIFMRGSISQAPVSVPFTGPVIAARHSTAEPVLRKAA